MQNSAKVTPETILKFLISSISRLFFGVSLQLKVCIDVPIK